MDCCQKKKERTAEDKKALINRLSRIEGQVRGIRKMIEDDAYFIDVLTQAHAVGAAVSAFEKELLSMHIKGCLIDDIKNGNDSTAYELIETLGKLIKN